MTADQKTELKKIIKKLYLIFPGSYCTISFNLAAGRRPANVNMTEDIGDGITVKENVKP